MQRLQVLPLVQLGQRPLDLFRRRVGDDGAHARLADEAAAQLGDPPPVVHAAQPPAAFEDPGRPLAVGAALLDHQQLGAHESSLRIRGPSGWKSFSR